MFWYLAKIPVRAAAMPTAMVVLMGSIACVVPEHTSIHSSRMCRVLGFISHKCHRFIKQSRKKKKQKQGACERSEWTRYSQLAKVALRLSWVQRWGCVFFSLSIFGRIDNSRVTSASPRSGCCSQWLLQGRALLLFCFLSFFLFFYFKYLCFTIFFHTMWSLELCS